LHDIATSAVLTTELRFRDSSMTNSARTSGRQVLPQRLAGISGAEAAAPLQFRHQQVDDVVQRVDLLGLRMAQHEAAAAARALKSLLEIIRDLRRGAGDRGGVAGRRAQAVLHELLERDLAIIAERGRKLLDEADRRRIGGDDALLELAQRELGRQ